MKLMWSALISPLGLILVHAIVLPFRVLESFIYLFIYYRVILRQLDLPGNPVGKLHNVVFGPWSFVRVGEVTLQPETQTKHNTG